MARANVSKPDRPLASLMEEAGRLGLLYAIPSVDEWPLWPTDHPYRRYSCDKKSPFLYAEGALDEAIRIYRTKGVKLRVYPCPLAIHFHLTKKSEWEEWPVDGLISN